MTQKVSKELYEQIKAEVIEEWKEEKRREARKRAEERRTRIIATDKLFEPTRSKYFLKVLAYLNVLSRAGQRFDIVQEVERIFSETEHLALKAIGEWSKDSAYKNNKANEANEMAEQILEKKLNKN